MSTTTTGLPGRAMQTVTARLGGGRAAVAAGLTDVDTLVASVPGLEVSPCDGGRQHARLALRGPAGATGMTFEGTLEVSELDRDSGQIAVELNGRTPDTGVQGAVTLTATVLDTETVGHTTVQITVLADPVEGISERSAAVLSSVGRRLLEQMAHNLEATASGTSPDTAESLGESRPTPGESLDPTPDSRESATPQAPTSPHQLQDSATGRATSVLIAVAASAVGVIVGRVLRQNPR